ncbi:MAG: NAD(P)-dependent alcohol dehydrogenase [Saprospiraceae bacterium]|nr:NAD(P)-dependent alcohol dehydrogenase [Saprospiraceae bacterium]
MKAAIHTKYGPPEVVSIGDLPKPEPKEDEILVKVCASTVNRTDAGFRSAEYFISRLFSGLFRPHNPVLGCEFAGKVVKVGSLVTEFIPGDRVFGFNDQTWGGHGEFMVIKSGAGVTKMPDHLTYEEAAPISEGAHYALGNIMASGIKKGQQAVVYGATGAIGSAAVQLLKYFGVEVTAVCNSKNVGLVKSLGADAVISYETEDYTITKKKFKLVFDAVGKSSFGACKKILSDDGVYISTELGQNGENIWRAILGKIFGGKRILFPLPETKKSDIVFLKQLVEEKKFKPLVDRTYVLDDIVEAYRYVETGQKIGNVVLLMNASEK